MPRTPDQLAEAAAEHYLGAVAALAAKVRSLADELERLGRVDVPRDPSPYTTAAADVVMNLLAGVASLNTYPVITRAAAADLAREEARTKATPAVDVLADIIRKVDQEQDAVMAGPDLLAQAIRDELAKEP
jgi:hypothetical protein